jgi:hypothetical protein
MQTFLSHGDACTRIEAEALQLATHGASEPDEDAPLQVYNDMLDNLGENLSHQNICVYLFLLLSITEKLHAEAAELESSILRFTSPSSMSSEAAHNESSSPADPETANAARSQIMGVFSACLPVIRARISNLAMAQDLIDGAQENLSISLRMESLGMD